MSMSIFGVRQLTCRRIFVNVTANFIARLRRGVCLRRLTTWWPVDEYRRLRSAGKTKNWVFLKHLALEANQQSIRHQAAMMIESEVFLSAIALNAWDIEQGQHVVGRIENELLLRRISTSARQDAIRLAAAEKLGNGKVLKRIALATADHSLRWKVARRLNDPHLFADVALFKPSRPHLDALRRQAHESLLRHLDEMADGNQNCALVDFVYQQDHLPFKLEAFLRLPLDYLNNATLHYLSQFDFLFVTTETVTKVFEKVRRAGWHVDARPKCISCRQCRGKGDVLVKTVSGGREPFETDVAVCPECCGKGRIEHCEVVCSKGENRKVAFRLPHSDLNGQSYLFKL